MKHTAFIFLLLLIISCNDKDPDPTPTADTFIRGADLSFLPEIETHNLKFFDGAGRSRCKLESLSFYDNSPYSFTGTHPVAICRGTYAG